MTLAGLRTWIIGQMKAAADVVVAGLATKQDVSQRGVSSGYASLDGSGKVPTSELPATMPPAAHASSHASAGSDPVTLAESQVTGLVADLAGKAAAVHTHAEADVTGLVADLAAKAPTSRTISAGVGLSGGGDLSANRTLNVLYGAVAGVACQGDDARLYPNSSYEGFLHDGSVFTSRRLFNCMTTVGLAGFGTMTTDRLYVTCGSAPDESTTPVMTSIGVEVTAAAASGWLYIYVYTSANGYGKVLKFASAKLPATSTGFVEDTGLAISFEPGQKIHVAVGTDATGVQIRGISVNAQASSYGRGAAGATNHIGGFYIDGVASGAPDPLSVPDGQLVGVAVPAIHATWANS